MTHVYFLTLSPSSCVITPEKYEPSAASPPPATCSKHTRKRCVPHLDRPKKTQRDEHMHAVYRLNSLYLSRYHITGWRCQSAGGAYWTRLSARRCACWEHSSSSVNMRVGRTELGGGSPSTISRGGGSSCTITTPDQDPRWS